MINELIKEIDNSLGEILTTQTLHNNSLTTIINCYSNLCLNEVNNFSKVFNSLFSSDKDNNILIVNLIENDILFDKALNLINSNELYTDTSAIKEFNKATITTSEIKSDKNNNYYIMRCYDYFIYVFDKLNKKCYMIIKKNKKAITMVNILLLTPYLMYGELFAVHGGLVNNKDSNILINNDSLGGKTTFAILFASKGWNIITEETTYITKDGSLLPYNIRNYFNIRLGTYLAFEDFFVNKNIINDEFLKMKDKTEKERFDYGKSSQFSIDFNDLGTILDNKEKMNITHSLKVSISKEQTFSMKECNPVESVNSFLKLSLSPTVLLFQELLNYTITDQDERRNKLIKIFSNTKSYIINSGFDYIDNYETIINTIKR